MTLYTPNLYKSVTCSTSLPIFVIICHYFSLQFSYSWKKCLFFVCLFTFIVALCESFIASGYVPLMKDIYSRHFLLNGYEPFNFLNDAF